MCTEKIFISAWTRLKMKQSSKALELLAGIKVVTSNIVMQMSASSHCQSVIHLVSTFTVGLIYVSIRQTKLFSNLRPFKFCNELKQLIKNLEH